MSRSAQVALDFGDDTYTFALKLGQLAELQDKTGAGPWYIQWALQSALMAETMGVPPSKDVSHLYVTETIRLGLIGGGLDPMQALKLVRNYAGEGQITANILLAHSIIAVALQGVPEDEPEKPEGEAATNANPSPKDGSDFPSSSEPGPQSD